MKPDERQSLERILESAIVVSWADLMRDAQAGLIHIEYGFASSGTFGFPEGLVIPDPRPLASGL
jgi:hypothetical protein